MNLNPVMRSANAHNFSRNPDVNIPRNGFVSPHNHITAIYPDKLYPLFVQEVVPGQTIKLDTTALVRFNALLTPFMDTVKVQSHYFYVPARLLWDHSQEFFTGRPDRSGEEPVDYILPVVSAPDGGWVAESLADYLDIRPGVEVDVNALPFRAYNLIWDEWFRPQFIVDPLVHARDEGPDDPALYELKYRYKAFDYFTSALPSPQAGEAVSMSLAGYAPVIGLGKYNSTFDYTPVPVRESDGSIRTYASAQAVGDAVDGRYFLAEEDPSNPGYPYIRTDLNGVSAITINQFREYLMLQTLAETEARFGQRYGEWVFGVFGISNPDGRLQRPEYLGGSSQPIYITPIQQTSASVEGQTPQGTLTATGVGLMTRDGFTKSFTEHGFVIGLFSVVSDITYSQGIERFWTYQTKDDFLIPMFSVLGEQAILNKEIFVQGTSADDEVFGYVPRFDHYRYSKSKITAKLRPDHATNLANWHLSQQFADLPVLSDEFLRCNMPYERVSALVDEPPFLMMLNFDMVKYLPIPAYSVPASLSRF